LPVSFRDKTIFTTTNFLPFFLHFTIFNHYLITEIWDFSCSPNALNNNKKLIGFLPISPSAASARL
jgi:hypothetical protein